MKEVFTIRTSISPGLMRKTLFKGFFTGMLGIISLLYAGVFLPVDVLRVWGLPIFLFGIGLIIIGLLPYRRIARIESKPSTLTVDNLEALEFSSGGKLKFSLPLEIVSKIAYLASPKNYGLGIWLKDHALEKVIFFEPSFKVRTDYGADIFLPYFSQRSTNELNDWIQE